MNTITPLKAVRAYCRECSGNQPKEVKLCPISACPLFNYRFGHNPARKGIGPRVRPLAQKSLGELVKTCKERVLHG